MKEKEKNEVERMERNAADAMSACGSSIACSQARIEGDQRGGKNKKTYSINAYSQYLYKVNINVTATSFDIV